ncbi:MAG: ABC transporter permease, partial [Acutalibacteraceae bacterium]|nr:ABC transporter permease [Acutalibacteraceae bacterium]
MNKKRRMFFRMIAASLVRRRSRMIIALLAVMVGATILSGLGMIYYDVPRQMSSQFRSYGANVIIMPSGEGFIMEQDLKTALKKIPDAELEGCTPYRYENTSIHNMPVTLAGIDFDSVLKTSPYWHISGELPEQDGQTLVGAKVADKLGIKTGDSISAVNSFEVTDSTDTSRIPDYEIYTDPKTGEKHCDHALDLKVTGILDTGGSEEEYVYVTLADTAYLSLSDRGYDIMEVSVAATQDKLSEYIDNINSSVRS